MRKGKKNFAVLILVAIVAFGLLGFNGIFQSPASIANNPGGTGEVPCINPVLPLPDNLHIHPHLTILVDGKNYTVPANLGLGVVTCERAIHTHDETGTIHIEPNFYIPFTLGDFFSVWGQPFSKDQILDYKADANHTLAMTVNGQPSTEFDKLVLTDKVDIVVRFDTLGTKQNSTGSANF